MSNTNLRLIYFKAFVNQKYLNFNFLAFLVFLDKFELDCKIQKVTRDKNFRYLLHYTIKYVLLFFLQNSTLSWHTTNPELTECFQKTVLVWVPCAYLWLAAFLDAYYILNSKEKNIPWNPLNITKLIVTCLLIVLKFVDLGVTVHRGSSDEDNVFNADYFSPILKIATFVSTERTIHSVPLIYQKNIIYRKNVTSLTDRLRTAKPLIAKYIFSDFFYK